MLRLPLSMKPQTASELLSPPTLYSSLYPVISLPVSTSLVLGLKACDFQILGLKCDPPLIGSDTLILDRSCVAQSGLKLIEIHLPLLPECLD